MQINMLLFKDNPSLNIQIHPSIHPLEPHLYLPIYWHKHQPGRRRKERSAGIGLSTSIFDIDSTWIQQELLLAWFITISLVCIAHRSAIIFWPLLSSERFSLNPEWTPDADWTIPLHAGWFTMLSGWEKNCRGEEHGVMVKLHIQIRI